MQNDFRNNIYKSYVSSFKTSQKQINDSHLKKLAIEYEHHTMPFLCDLDDSSPILELGCGPGYLLKYLKKRGFNNLTGIDISKEQVDIALKNGLNVLHENAFDFLLKKQSVYQAILAIDFVEHFRKDELFDLFAGINSAMKKDGILIIQTPNGQGLFPGQVIYGDLTHMTIFVEDSLRHILQYSGFGNMRFYETSPTPHNFEGKVRLALWNMIRASIKLARQIEAKNNSKIWTENMICVCNKN